MPDDDKTTNTNQPIIEEVPTIGQPDPTTTPVPSPTTTPDTPPGQVINTPPPPPMEDGAVSPPPPIVEEKKPEETTTTTQETGTTEDLQEIPDIPPVITTSDKGGKKPVSKKMIATILGVLVLVGGIGAGVILVQNQQDIREKADFEVDDGGGGSCILDGKCMGPGESCCNGNYFDTKCYLTETRCGTKPAPPVTCVTKGNNCDSINRCCSGLKCTSAGICLTSDPQPECINDNDCKNDEVCKNEKCVKKDCIADGECVTSSQICCNGESFLSEKCGYAECGEEPLCLKAGQCLVPGQNCCPGLTMLNVPFEECHTTETKCVEGSPPSPPKPTLKPPLPPGIDCSCLTIKAFDDEWNIITNLSSLVAGDVVRFTVSGKTNSGSIDKAKFTINGTPRSEVTVKRPNTKEFYDEYTIPESVTTFTINAELHHTKLGWF